MPTLCILGCLPMTRYRRHAFPSTHRWQDMREMRSRGSCRGKIPPRCVPGCSTMAKCSRNALPSVRRWQDCALMRSWSDWQWQYSCAMRSRVSIRGNISPRCVPGRHPWHFFASCIPKVALGRGESPVRGNDSHTMHPKTGWLWQDLRAMHPKCPANRRRRIHRAKILPGRGAFRCTGPSNHARRANTCHRSTHERKGSGRKCLRFVKN